MKATHSFLSLRGGLLLAAAAPFACAGSFAADITWNTGDGEWGNPANWLGGEMPTSSDRAYFRVVSGKPEDATVSVNGVYTSSHLMVWQGKTLNLQMANGSVLNSNATWIGTSSASEPSRVTYLNITGPLSGSATVNATSLAIGQSANNVGNVVTLSGSGLTVNTSTNVVLGAVSHDNRLVVSDGAKLNTHQILVSGANTSQTPPAGGNGNSLLVTGAGTHVTTNGSYGQGLWVGSASRNGLSTSNRQHGNSATISDGARLTINGVNAYGTGDVTLRVGAQFYRNANAVTVEGSGSVLELVKDSKGVGIIVGNNNDSGSSYDNSLTVRNGGLLRTQGKTEILGTNTTAAKNRLVIGSGGTFQTDSAVNVDGGLLQLAAGGTLSGSDFSAAAVAVSVDVGATKRSGFVGRMEAAGGGLGQSVTVNINDRGVLAVGLADTTEASVLTLDSVLNFASGSALELRIFGSNAADSIFLGTAGQMSIGDGATLSLLVAGSYTLKAGDSWQVFDGNTGAISGTFSDMVLPTLGGDLAWDVSAFNEAGNWTLTVVPEPGSVALVMALALGCCGILRRRRLGRENRV